MWNINRTLRFFRHSFEVAKTGEILPLAEKLLQKKDGTYLSHAFVDLPMGMRRIQNFLFVACPQITRAVPFPSFSLKKVA